MTSLDDLFSSSYLGHYDCQADYEKVKLTLKQKTISQISCGWDDSLGTLTLDCKLWTTYIHSFIC